MVSNIVDQFSGRLFSGRLVDSKSLYYRMLSTLKFHHILVSKLSLSGLLKVLLGIPYPVKPDDGNIIVFTGGAALTCLEFDHTRKRIGICFMNQPIIGEKEIRTGHKNMGGAFKNEW